MTPVALSKENMVSGLRGRDDPYQSVILRRAVDRGGAMRRVRCNCQNCIPHIRDLLPSLSS